MRRRKQRLTLSFVAIDLAALLGAWLLAYLVRFYAPLVASVFPPEKGIPPLENYVRVAPLIAAIGLSVFSLQGLYRLRRPFSAIDDAIRTFAALLVTAALALGVTLYIRIYIQFAPEVAPNWEYSQVSFGLFALWGTLLVLMLRRLLLAWFERGWARGENAVRILVAGTSDLGRTVAARLMAQRRLGYSVVGFLSETTDEGTGAPLQILGSLGEVNKVISDHQIDSVYVALPVERHADMVELVHTLTSETVDVRVVPDLLQCLTLRAGIEDLDGIPIVSLNETPMRGLPALIKRALDVVGASLGLLFLSPFFLVIAVAIKVRGGRGPVLYAQDRVTLDGHHFSVYKFRTMKEDAEVASGPVWASENDPRRTSLGVFLRKYNLDEFPQLINVVRGDMSLVGPRPERPHFVEQFKTKIPNYMLRHRVKSGLTGWAQVHGWRGNTSLEKRIEFDLYYIENWSLMLDFKILVLTLFRGFGQTHAY